MFDPVVLPWVSDQDIELGSRSMGEIEETLDRSSFGIILVTRANQHSQWVNFEAGALSKRIGESSSSVIPLLVDFERISELTGPLSQFQACLFEESTLRRVMSLIGERARVSPSVTERRFANSWPMMLASLQAARDEHGDSSHLAARGTDDVLDEMLQIMRDLHARRNESELRNKLGLDRQDVNKPISWKIRRMFGQRGIPVRVFQEKARFRIYATTPLDNEIFDALVEECSKVFPGWGFIYGSVASVGETKPPRGSLRTFPRAEV